MRDTLSWIYPDQEFKIYQGYLIGNKNLILNSRFKEVRTKNVLSIKGKSYRRDRLIAKIWLGEPEKNQRLIFLDGDKNNLSVSNLKYKDKSKKELKRQYIKKVNKITKEQPLHLLKDFDKRNFNGYHLDHIISIQKGWKNNISSSIIGHISNLQMITEKENIDKSINSYCVIAQCDHLKRKIE